MKTKPIYLEDPYRKTMQAQILDVSEEKEGVYKVILDQTIFYPMGGGQPTDQGYFLFEDDGSTGEVYQVLLKEGEICHFVKTARKPSVGETLTGTIDWPRRYKNMRVHPAGHVIDFALYLLGYSPSPLNPMKGDHGKKPFIVYLGKLEQNIHEQLQNKTNELIKMDLTFSWRFELLEQLEKQALYLQPGLPKNKPLRALELEGVGVVADGGTIVAKTSEVGSINILAIESNEVETIIRYQVD